MIVRHMLILVALAAISGATLLVKSASAQDPFPFNNSSDNIRLFESTTDSSSRSDVGKTGMSVSELRQSRALYRANQRVARIEYNLWIGHEPLRPKWNTIPMMTSRYTSRKIYVPVYIRSR